MPHTVPHPDFTPQLLHWFYQYGRHDLPWQITAAEQGTAHGVYKVWLSEIMLQQTQVKTVLPFFLRFMQRFSSINQLAAATWDDVAPYWAGLGYYARARHLHQAAQHIARTGLPQSTAGWQQLPGIGKSTAGAIMALGFGQHGVILDGNVKRVLSRIYRLPTQGTTHEKHLWQLAEQHTSTTQPAAYAQAIMDFGATLCTPKNPLCAMCPQQTVCEAYAHGQVALFPPAKQKKQLPHHTVQLWVLQNHQHQLLWIQRPTGAGIWAGLWTLPLMDVANAPSITPTDVPTHATPNTPITLNNTLYAAACTAIQHSVPLPTLCHTLKHTFSHYHLHLHVFNPVPISQTVQQHIEQHFNAHHIAYAWHSLNDLPAMPTAMQKVVRILTNKA